MICVLFDVMRCDVMLCSVRRGVYKAHPTAACWRSSNSSRRIFLKKVLWCCGVVVLWCCGGERFGGGLMEGVEGGLFGRLVESGGRGLLEVGGRR